MTVLTVDGAKRKLNATTGSVALRGATVRLTAAGAAALRRALKLERLAPGVLGTLTVDAKRGTTHRQRGVGTPDAARRPRRTPGGGTSAADRPTARAPTHAHRDLGGPAPLARPATAVDVTAARDHLARARLVHPVHQHRRGHRDLRRRDRRAADRPAGQQRAVGL